MYIHLHGLAQPSDPMPNPLAYSPTPSTLLKCDNRQIPERTAVRALTARRVACTQANTGVTDPFGVLSRAVARALEMLDKTIGKLMNARNAVCAGATPPLPLRDITAQWLRNRLGVCVDDVHVWTAGVPIASLTFGPA